MSFLEINNQKKIYMVLGVARGGTSIIARALEALGISLGEHLVPDDPKWNAKGFWEDEDIVYNIHGRIFEVLNFAPYGIKMLEAAELTSSRVQEIKQSAKQLLSERFQHSSVWGFKDPSSVKVLAFWQNIFAELGIHDNYIICLRNPLSSAHSYSKLTGCELEVGLLLWLMHLMPAIADTQHKARIVVSYEQMLLDPLKQLQRIQAQLQIPDSSMPQALNLYTQEFVDPSLHHNHFSRADLTNHPALNAAPLCLKLYDFLFKLATDEIKFTDIAFESEWHMISNELQKIYPIYEYVDVLLKRNNQLQRSLQKIQHSTTWKMLGPFRVMYDKWRASNRQLRKKRRLVKAYG